MREEWPVTARVVPPSSWSARRLIGSATLVALALLGIGVGLGRLLSPGVVAAGSGAVPTEVAGAVEVAPLEPESDIGGAVASERRGPLAPASVDHLTVVHVSVSVCGARSTGSGVVVADGLLLTAAHVVGDAALVRIDQGGISVTGEVLGVLADERDLALVAVDAIMPAPLGAGTLPEIGGPVTLLGFPDGGSRMVAVGARLEVAPIVATLAGGGEIVGVDVGIDPGMSGGPAADAAGDVVGVVVAKEVGTDTALVVATPDLAAIGEAALVPGSCPGSA